jgi:hypothetical protein
VSRSILWCSPLDRPTRDAERFIEEVHSDDPELASYLRIEERELGAGQRELDAKCERVDRSFSDGCPKPRSTPPDRG